MLNKDFALGQSPVTCLFIVKIRMKKVTLSGAGMASMSLGILRKDAETQTAKLTKTMGKKVLNANLNHLRTFKGFILEQTSVKTVQFH